MLIIAPDLSHPHPDAVARRPGQLTWEDKIKLLSQPSELDIVRARYVLDKRQKLVDVKSGHKLSRDEVIEDIAHLLNTTQNDGGKGIKF